MQIKIVNVTLNAQHPIDLGANPGSSLRGALLDALQYVSADNTLLHWMLDEHIPRPIAVRPPLTNHTKQIQFTLAIYGNAANYLSDIERALYHLPVVGIGRNRQHNQFVTHSIAVDDWHNVFRTPSYKRLTVRFVTPARIIHKGRLSKSPTFHHWFARLIGRIHRLAKHYEDSPQHVPFDSLHAQAGKIRCVSDKTHWVDAVSHSTRDGMAKPTGGYIGTATYTGDLLPIMAWIVMGQAVQIGKNTSKGCGWYTLEANT